MIKRNPCKKEGCSLPRFSGGLCSLHHRQEFPDKYKIKPAQKPLNKAGTKLPKKKRIAPVSAKQAARLREYRKLRDEYMSLHTKCEVRGCNRPSEDLHHGAGRLGDLLTDVRYFKALCREHHRWVEENPTEAKEVGLSFNRLDK